MKLSKHFTLNEFTSSMTARKLGINNEAPESVVENLRNLCIQVLEPLRQHVGVPITITSGYRCAQLNAMVGGGKNSQHKFGEAADIHLPLTDAEWFDGLRHTDMETARKWFNWLRDNTDYDQLIMETSNGKEFWIHVSCRRDQSRNRHQVISYMRKN